MNKKEFLIELSKRANLYLKDTKFIWKHVEDIFEDAVRTRTEILLSGLLKLYYTKYSSGKRFDPNSGEYVERAATERVSLKISSKYKDIIKK